MDPESKKSLSRRELWSLLFVQSALLCVLGAALLWWNGIGVHFRWPGFRETLLALALTGPLLLSSMLLLRYSARYLQAVELLERVLGPPVRPLDIPFLAIVSAAVEEFFFRGVLQALVGVWAAAAIFGLAHVWHRRLMIHGIWAALAGLYLGLVYQHTGNLAVPILTHAVNNLVGLSLLKGRHPR